MKSGKCITVEIGRRKYDAEHMSALVSCVDETKR